jgi:DNA-binding NtrC family response regulator
MSANAQAKVLRALQESRITRVGGDKEISVDVRVVAATNKDLQSEINRGMFREDLYYRLAVILIHVPTLDSRKDDIPLLVDHFNQMICKEYGVTPKMIDSDAMSALQEVSWSGNIRELRNVVERLIILSQEKITKEDILSFVVASSSKNRSKLTEIFSKFKDVDDLHSFISKEFEKYQQPG